MRQFRTYGSVGALGGRPPRATRFDPFQAEAMSSSSPPNDSERFQFTH